MNKIGKNLIQKETRKCKICKKEIPTEGRLKNCLPIKNTIVCSDKCCDILGEIFEIKKKIDYLLN